MISKTRRKQAVWVGMESHNRNLRIRRYIRKVFRYPISPPEPDRRAVNRIHRTLSAAFVSYGWRLMEEDCSPVLCDQRILIKGIE